MWSCLEFFPLSFFFRKGYTKQEIRVYFSLVYKRCRFSGWWTGGWCIEKITLHTNKSTACSLHTCKHLWVRLFALFDGSNDIWFEYDTNSQNAAYQWELKVKILQGGLGKAVGHKRYLTELADVWQDGFKKCAVWSVVGVCFRSSGVLFESLLWCNFSLVVFILFPDRSRKHWEFQRRKLQILLSGLLVWIYGIKWCTTPIGFFSPFPQLALQRKGRRFCHCHQS